MRRLVACVFGAAAGLTAGLAAAQTYPPAQPYGYGAAPQGGYYGQPGYYPPQPGYTPGYGGRPAYRPPAGQYPPQAYPPGYYPPQGGYPPRGGYSGGGYYPPGSYYPPGGGYSPPGGGYYPPPGQGYGRECQDQRARFAVGRRYSPGLAEQARRAASAAVVRAVRPDMAYTREFRADRLNLELDRGGWVRAVRCG